MKAKNRSSITTQPVDSVCTQWMIDGSRSIDGWFARIPNIRGMKLGSKRLDELFLAEGISKNVPRELEFKLLDNNDTINRYVRHQTRRLWLMKKAGKSKAFFRIAWHLLEKSLCFYLVGLCQVCPTWYKDLPFLKVRRLRLRYLKRLNEASFDISRVYIPKGETVRPLGVPGLACRIVLALVTKFLQLWMADLIDKGQHAYQPGKGVLTAWKQVVEEALPSQYIYEFDLKNFFGETPLHILTDILEYQIQVNGKFLNYIKKYLQSTVFIIKPHPDINEDSNIAKSAMRKWHKESGIDQNFDGLAYGYGNQLWQALGGLMSVEGAQQALLKGVPQGGNASPLLAIVLLSRLFETVEDNGHKLVMYADDGIIYSDKPIDPSSIFHPGMETLGMIHHPDKSRHVKVKGQWIEVLKFLGLQYDGNSDKLQAKTRNGATLEFALHNLTTALRHRSHDVSPDWKSFFGDLVGTKWTEFIQSSALGFFVSRLFNNDWNLEVDQDMSLRYRKSSWVNKYGLGIIPDMQLSNASSFAYVSLLDILSIARRRANRMANLLKCHPTKVWTEVQGGTVDKDISIVVRCQKGNGLLETNIGDWYGIEGRITKDVGDDYSYRNAKIEVGPGEWEYHFGKLQELGLTGNTPAANRAAYGSSGSSTSKYKSWPKDSTGRRVRPEDLSIARAKPLSKSELKALRPKVKLLNRELIMERDEKNTSFAYKTLGELLAEAHTKGPETKS